MRKIGVIMEINPFHNGHKYFLKSIPKQKDDILIAIISTSVVQRGEFTCLNKHDKAQLLLDTNVDIVIELPGIFANQGGLHFAYHAVEYLNLFEITDLYFGSESGDLEMLISLSNSLDTKIDFKVGIHKNTLSSLLSNDILGLSYIRSIQQINPQIHPHIIKRVSNNYNDELLTSGNIASATSIRRNINSPDLVKDFLPNFALQHIQTINNELFFNLFKHNLNIAVDLNMNIFLSEDCQLLYRFKKILVNNPDIDFQDFINLAKNKNNSQFKIQRVMLNTCLLVDNYEQFNKGYVHVLGFTKKGSLHLKDLRSNNQDVNFVTTLKDCTCATAILEKRISLLFNQLTNQTKKHDYMQPILKS